MSEFTHVSSLITVPEDLFLHRPEHYSKDRASLNWECPIHGMVPPKKLANGYICGRCPCVRMKQEFEEQSAIRLTIKQNQIKQRASKTYSWLGPEFSEVGLEGQTFTSFDCSRQQNPQRFQIILQQVKEMTQQIITDPTYQRNLILYGNWGTGKTHLAAAILNELREAGIHCLFTTAEGLLDAMYDQIGKHGSTATLEAKAADTRVLVIDDLDKLHIPQGSEEPYQHKVFFKILDKRYKRRLSTIITTNKADPTPYVGEAVTSRLQVGLLTLQMNGIDQRQVRII